MPRKSVRAALAVILIALIGCKASWTAHGVHRVGCDYPADAAGSFRVGVTTLSDATEALNCEPFGVDSGVEGSMQAFWVYGVEKDGVLRKEGSIKNQLSSIGYVQKLLVLEFDNANTLTMVLANYDSETPYPFGIRNYR